MESAPTKKAKYHAEGEYNCATAGRLHPSAPAKIRANVRLDRITESIKSLLFRRAGARSRRKQKRNHGVFALVLLFCTKPFTSQFQTAGASPRPTVSRSIPPTPNSRRSTIICLPQWGKGDREAVDEVCRRKRSGGRMIFSPTVKRQNSGYTAFATNGTPPAPSDMEQRLAKNKNGVSPRPERGGKDAVCPEALGGRTQSELR